MPYLIDTSVLVRLANQRDAKYAIATDAISGLHRRGEAMYVTPQVLIEFRNVATRPVAVNGLGLSIAESEQDAEAFEKAFAILPDTPDVFPAWKTLVGALGVIGKRVHDARLVAVCHVHGISHLLTFNGGHFAGMASFGPGITVVDPASV